MNASMMPLEAASKHSNGGMIWPPGKTSIRELRLLYDLRQPLGRALEHVERRGPGRGHAPLDLRLCDDVRSVDEGGGSGSRHRAARLRNEPASVVHHILRTSVDKTQYRGVYSITWSARSSSDGGMVRPRALAVLRLMTSSNFVGCSTGRSEGLAPLRILST